MYKLYKPLCGCFNYITRTYKETNVTVLTLFGLFLASIQILEFEEFEKKISKNPYPVIGPFNDLDLCIHRSLYSIKKRFLHAPIQDSI